MPEDSQAFVTEWKGKQIDGKQYRTALPAPLRPYLCPILLAIVEQVRDGTTLRVRLLMPDGEHQVVNIALAGVRSARASTKQGEPSEPWGEEVGCFSLGVSPVFSSIHRLNSLLSLACFNAQCASRYSRSLVQPRRPSKLVQTPPRLHLLAFSLAQVTS